MVFNKKIAKIIICTLLIGSLSNVKAQSLQQKVHAFSESYTQETKGDYAGSIKTLKALNISDQYEIELRLGWLHYLAGMQIESIKHYQSAIKIMPFSIEAKFGLIYPISTLGNWDQVKDQYESILKIDSKNTLALYRLSLLNYNKKEYATARKHLETVVNLYPFDFDGLSLLGYTYLQLGMKKEAKIVFGKCLLSQPSNDTIFKEWEKLN